MTWDQVLTWIVIPVIGGLIIAGGGCGYREECHERRGARAQWSSTSIADW